MTRDQLQACTKKTLADMAREAGVAGWHGMRKDELILALEEFGRKSRKRTRPTAVAPVPKASDAKESAGRKASAPETSKKKVIAPVQKAAARNTSGNPSPEEQVENSKFDVGIPTRDLSAKV